MAELIKFVILSTVVVLFNGCFDSPSFLKKNQSTDFISHGSVSKASISAVSEAGVETAFIKSGGNITQEITVGADSSVAGTVVSFPPGSLGIDMSIAIEEGLSVATAGVSAELGLADNIASSGTAVSVQPSVDSDPLEPFTLAISLPEAASLGLNADYANLIVLYKVKKVAEDQVYAGFLTREFLEVVGGSVIFASDYFGSFQVAYTKAPVTQAVQVAVTTPIQTMRDVASLPPIAVKARSPFVVASGSRVMVQGQNFRPTMTLALGGVKVANMKVLSDVQASFDAPNMERFGLLALTVDQDGVSQDLSIFYTGAKSDLPIMTQLESEVCSGIKYYDGTGALKTGTKSCSGPAACSSNGQIGCVTTTTYKAADLANLNAANIKSGVPIAGVNGTYSVPALADCAIDGQIDCKAVNAFRAVEYGKLSATNIIAGISIAGVVGMANVAPGQCNSDGQVGCVTVPGFAAADLSNISPANILAGVTIAGVMGVMSSGSPNCTADGQIGCQVDGTNFGAAELANLSSKVVAGQMVAGVTGSVMPSPQTCAMDGSVGCVATAAYPAVSVANLHPANLRRGIVIGGIAGQFPSSIYPLPRYMDDGSTAATQSDGGIMTNLTMFSTQITTGGNFEFWDSAGVRRTGSGDADIAPANVASGIFFDNLGVAGTAMTGPSCGFDGEMGCFTNAQFKAMDTSLVYPWDIRLGKSAGGVLGQLVYYKNMADTATFNRVTGAGASAGLDLYDTLDDYNLNGAIFLSETPGAWPPQNPANWLRDPVTDNGIGAGVLNDGLCNGTEDCIFKDRLTGIYWTKRFTTVMPWENAVNYCHSLNYGGQTAGTWRLPTQKETMQAYINGIWLLKDPTKLDLIADNVWSASTTSMLTTSAWGINLAYGASAPFSKSTTKTYHCVR